MGRDGQGRKIGVGVVGEVLIYCVRFGGNLMPLLLILKWGGFCFLTLEGGEFVTVIFSFLWTRRQVGANVKRWL